MENVGYSLKEAMEHQEDLRAIRMQNPGYRENVPWTKEDYKKHEEVLRKMGVSKEAIDELKEPW